MNNLVDRFYEKVAITDGCWLWMGNNNGKYGKIRGVGGKSSRHLFAHRVSFEIHKADIPDGKIIMHTCDTPLCVNPEHLVLGTHKQNTDDMIAKGRSVIPRPKRRFGDNHHNTRVSDLVVEKIRSEYTGRYGEQIKLARKYGVTPNFVSTVISNKARTKYAD